MTKLDKLGYDAQTSRTVMDESFTDLSTANRSFVWLEHKLLVDTDVCLLVLNEDDK